MSNENLFKINGTLISVAEQESDPSRKVAKFLLCPLDEANVNGKGIKESDLSEEEMNTLMGQPLVTKVIFDEKTKEYNFSGHLMTKKWKYDKDGNLVKFSDFTSTSPIGYHTSVSIEDIEFGDITKRCLVAEVILWTRYYRAMEVIERLGTELHTSWELSYSETYKEDGTDWLKGILFLANCVLGSNVNPAYKNAGLLECAEEVLIEEQENEFTEAFINDLNEISQSERQENIEISIQSDENSVENKLNQNIEEKGGIVDMAENKNKTEVSSVTSNDLYSKLRVAINSIDSNRWICISRVYPYEFRAIGYDWNAECEDDYIEFSYTVDSNEVVSIVSETPTKMVFVPKTQNDEILAELQSQLDNANTSLSDKETELSAKVDEIVKLGESLNSQKDIISEKEAIISELDPLKLQMEQAEAEKKEAEIAEQKENLKKMALSSKYFTEEEIETCEALKEAIEKLDDKQIKCLIAERVVEQASKIETPIKEVEISEFEKKTISEIEMSTDINTNNYEYKDASSALLNYARRNIKR